MEIRSESQNKRNVVEKGIVITTGNNPKQFPVTFKNYLKHTQLYFLSFERVPWFYLHSQIKRLL
jgi:hypothetical protein